MVLHLKRTFKKIQQFCRMYNLRNDALNALSNNYSINGPRISQTFMKCGYELNIRDCLKIRIFILFLTLAS